MFGCQDETGRVSHVRNPLDGSDYTECGGEDMQGSHISNFAGLGTGTRAPRSEVEGVLVVVEGSRCLLLSNPFMRVSPACSISESALRPLHYPPSHPILTVFNSHPYQTLTYNRSLHTKMFFTTALLISLLISCTLSSPLAIELLTRQTPTPPASYPNRTNNPFYPCGYSAAIVSACPYRCYTRSGVLLNQCFTQSTATAAINTLKSICVKCEIPNQPEDYPGGCEPLHQYFVNRAPPSRCGFRNHRLRECAWNCNDIQVPFDLCDPRDDTRGMFRICEKCKPQCSSPRIVFRPSFLPNNFSIAAGSCSAQYGPQQNVACPWRCTDGGNPNTYCSLDDKTENRFTTCTRCG